MTPTLESVLAQCDDCGVNLTLNGDKVAFSCSSSGMPASLRDSLLAVRTQLVGHLTEHPRPLPCPVLFVGTQLDVWSVWSGLARGVVSLYSRQRPYYRLTPQVWWYLATMLDRGADRDPSKLPALQDAASIVADLGRWVDCHYRPDQIQRAIAAEPALPRIRKPDPPEPPHATCPKAIPPATATPARR